MTESIKQLAQELLQKMSVEFDSLEITEEDNGNIRINIISPQDSGLLIGWHGQTLLAIQHILRTIFVKQNESDITITVDVEDYRKKQEENILELAKRKAERVLETGEEELMPPMHPYYRKIVHQFFSETTEFEGIATSSEGEGNKRQLKLSKA